MMERAPDPQRSPYAPPPPPRAHPSGPLQPPPPPPPPPPRPPPPPQAQPVAAAPRMPLSPMLPPGPPMAGSFAARDEALEALLEDDARRGPSGPIVLLSATFGVAAGVITLYVAYTAAKLRVEVSVVLAVLALCFVVGATGALLSAATGSRAALPTIGLSCAVIVGVLLMLGLCMVLGALAASVLLTLGG